MKRQYLIIAFLIVTFSFLIMYGIYLHGINRVNIIVLKENLKYLKSLRDPTLKPDGTPYLGSFFGEFMLKDLSGTSFQLASVQALFKMIIVFDLNDCNTCLNEYRLWTKLNNKYPPDILSVIGICTSRDKQAISNFIEDRKISFPILWDPEKTIKSNMKFRASPLRIFLDRYNNILDIEETSTTNEHQQYIVSMIDSRIGLELSNISKFRKGGHL